MRQDSFETLPNALTEIHLRHLGATVVRVPAVATYYALRDFMVNVIDRTGDADGFADAVERRAG